MLGLVGCDSLAGILIAEPRSFTRMGLEVAIRDGAVVLTAEHPFAAVACGPVVADPRQAADQPPPATWRARCRDFTDCVSAVRYGDPMLEADVSPTPLATGPCYSCNVKGQRGWGTVEFVLTADGRVQQPCPRITPSRRE
jgi:hypothetical protein